MIMNKNFNLFLKNKLIINHLKIKTQRKRKKIQMQTKYYKTKSTD